MSQYSEIMEELAAIRAENAWLVTALKRLLLDSLGVEDPGWQLEAPLDELDLEDDELTPDPNEHVAVRRKGKTRGCAHVQTAIRGGHVTCVACGGDLGCAHNQQAVVSGKVICAVCGTPLAQTGVVGRDPNAPVAGSETHEESSKNPGRTPSYAN